MRGSNTSEGDEIISCSFWNSKTWTGGKVGEEIESIDGDYDQVQKALKRDGNTRRKSKASAVYGSEKLANVNRLSEVLKTSGGRSNGYGRDEHPMNSTEREARSEKNDE